MAATTRRVRVDPKRRSVRVRVGLVTVGLLAAAVTPLLCAVVLAGKVLVIPGLTAWGGGVTCFGERINALAGLPYPVLWARRDSC